MSTFARFSEQPEAARLLDAALRDGPAHAYLFHGPPGVGKREVARAFARALLETTREFHPDLYELDALGEMIRIDAIRELRRDLHMRPFEADRRVYLIHHAHLMNEDAADALLKDLEEPPPYAVIVLIADDLGPLPETIRSRCQLVPFRRLSERAIRELVDARAPQLDEDDDARRSRASRPGRIDRLERLLDPAAAARRDVADRAGARRLPRSGLRSLAAAAAHSLANAQARGRRGARAWRRRGSSDLELPAREARDSACSAPRAAPSGRSSWRSSKSSRAWYRDLVAVAVGAERRGDPPRQAGRCCARTRRGSGCVGAERAAEAVRETWRGARGVQPGAAAGARERCSCGLRASLR